MTKWTKEEEDILTELYTNWEISVDEIADRLGRTNRSISSKARDMGLRRPIPTDMTLEMEMKLRVVLLKDGEVIRSFDAEIPKYVRGIYSDSEFLRSIAFYDKLQNVMKGKAT